MSSQPNKSLIDGIRCFQELTTSQMPLGTKELAERLGINVVRANRLLRTMSSIGMAEQDVHKKYMPGPLVHVLAAQSFHSSALFQAATKVAINTFYDDRTLAIGVLWKDSVVYLYHARPQHSPAEGLVGYHLYNAQRSSIGQALLAEMSDEEIEDCITYWGDERKLRIREKVAACRRDGFILRHNTEGVIENVASVLSVGGAKAGIAFSDILIPDEKISDYVAELRALIEKIEAYGSDQIKSLKTKKGAVS